MAIIAAAAVVLSRCVPLAPMSIARQTIIGENYTDCGYWVWIRLDSSSCSRRVFIAVARLRPAVIRCFRVVFNRL